MRMIPSILMLAILATACEPVIVAKGNDTQLTQSATYDKVIADSNAIRRSDPNAISPTTALMSQLSKNMTYANFRKQVLASGWEPVRNPDCLVDVVGGEYKNMCSSNLNSALCAACNKMPELQAYGAGGHALLRFTHPNDDLTLKATAFGEFEDEAGNQEYSPGMLITNWEFSKEQ